MEQNEDLTHCWQKHKTEQHFKGTDICHMIQQLLLCISSKKKWKHVHIKTYKNIYHSLIRNSQKQSHLNIQLKEQTNYGT